jgi:hypothetical protein
MLPPVHKSGGLRSSDAASPSTAFTAASSKSHVLEYDSTAALFSRMHSAWSACSTASLLSRKRHSLSADPSTTRKVRQHAALLLRIHAISRGKKIDRKQIGAALLCPSSTLATYKLQAIGAQCVSSESSGHSPCRQCEHPESTQLGGAVSL